MDFRVCNLSTKAFQVGNVTIEYFTRLVGNNGLIIFVSCQERRGKAFCLDYRR